MCATWAGLGTYGSNGLLSLLALVVVLSDGGRLVASSVIRSWLMPTDCGIDPPVFDLGTDSKSSQALP